MNPPLWAMLIAVIVASIPKLQHLIFDEDTFISNSVTRAVTQSGGVAVPLILVVLGANLARNTLPQEAHDVNSEENQIGTKLLIASLISRMLLPTLIMAPMLALSAKYIPVSILDDPIFVIVCFLLTGAPSALQLAQICQINGVYEGVMSKLLFQSYVIWYVPPHIQSPYSLSLTKALGFSHQHSSSSCARLKSSNGRTCNLFPSRSFFTSF
jgi:predicted permease